ncbi:MAG: hypothetical protein JWQ54_1731 [Mucilaginibacter sp.]|nr:hypothetical protein [Mucilaginibacter sp.]
MRETNGTSGTAFLKKLAVLSWQWAVKYKGIPSFILLTGDNSNKGAVQTIIKRPARAIPSLGRCMEGFLRQAFTLVEV